ncbi:HAD family hydrolase [Lysobacter sp. CA196]|uniref:HAD family hydrolase n=1 Tax=Lysobacter sp. CA196 TaxID=3455606 RepID=UPI003F8D51D4
MSHDELATLPNPRYRVLLLDFDGVLRQWPDCDDAIEIAHGLPVGSLRRIAFVPALLDQALAGRITDEQWREQVAERLRATYPGSAAEAAVGQWSQPCGQLDTEVMALLDACRPDLRLVLVSNATTRLARDLQTLGLSERFDAVVNSSELGMIKPEPEIFRAAFARAGVEARQALFVDDDADNVAAAVELGAHGLRYRDCAGLRSWLEAADALRD